MLKHLISTLVALALCGLVAFGVASASSSRVGVPQAIIESSVCPAAGCASGSCHGFDDVPEPDGIHEMDCPEAACASIECHAWETLRDSHYGSASDASLFLWLLVPALVVAGAIALSRGGGGKIG